MKKEKVKKYSEQFKILFFLILIFSFTGCTVEYNLNIDDGFTEKVSFIVPNTDAWQKNIDVMAKKKQFAYTNDNSNKYYDLEVTKKDNIKLDYTYKYDVDSITKSNAINQCYKTVSVDPADGYIHIMTSETFLCLNRDGYQVIDKAIISITTKEEVVKNNADEVKAGTYIWNIDQSNYENKPIEIKLKNPQASQDQAIKIIKNNSFLFIIIFVVILLVPLFLLIKHKRDAINKI